MDKQLFKAKEEDLAKVNSFLHYILNMKKITTFGKDAYFIFDELPEIEQAIVYANAERM